MTAQPKVAMTCISQNTSKDLPAIKFWKFTIHFHLRSIYRSTWFYSIINGNVSADDTFVPVGVVEPGDVFLIVGPNSTQQLLDQADAIDNIAAFNGDDVIELRHNSVLIDVIGELGERIPV
jgi:hypothetical protein